MRTPLWLRRLRGWLASHDPQWKPTGVIVKFEHYDQDKAVAGYAKSRRQTETGPSLSTSSEGGRGDRHEAGAAVSAMKHVAAAVQEELDARGWTRDALALHMAAYDYGIHRLTLDMMFALTEEPNATIGPETDAALCHAFGISAGFFTRLEQGFKKQVEAGLL